MSVRHHLSGADSIKTFVLAATADFTGCVWVLSISAGPRQVKYLTAVSTTTYIALLHSLSLPPPPSHLLPSLILSLLSLHLYLPSSPISSQGRWLTGIWINQYVSLCALIIVTWYAPETARYRPKVSRCWSGQDKNITLVNETFHLQKLCLNVMSTNDCERGEKLTQTTGRIQRSVRWD